MENILEINLPEGIIEDFSPVQIPLKYDRQLVFSDVHVPYYSKEALSIVLLYGLKNSANCIIINGDFLDFYKASRFNPDPRARGLKDEIIMAREILSKIRDLFPNAAIYFKEGNHDERWEHYLRDKAPELLDMEEFRLDVILHLSKMNIQYVRDKKILQAGKLNYVHGHEFGKGFTAPVNPARGFYTKGKQTMVGGHHHQTLS